MDGERDNRWKILGYCQKKGGEMKLFSVSGFLLLVTRIYVTPANERSGAEKVTINKIYRKQ